MHPILFSIGPITLHTYGFLIAVGFLLALQVLQALARRSNLSPERVTDLAFWLLMSGFVGSRILFIITRWEEFSVDPLAMFQVWKGGLVFFGGPIAALPVAVWYLRKHKLPVWKTMDVLVPGLTLAHAFGRSGCFAAGCCYGKPTHTEWGVKFYSDLVDRAYHGINLHPTQLYEASALLILFTGLILVFRKKKFDGQVVLTYFMTYPLIRSVVEEFRGDTIRGFVIEDVLSTSQFISILVFLCATVALIFRLKTLKSENARS